MARKSNLIESIEKSGMFPAGNISASTGKKPASHLPKGAVGALAAGLSQLHASGIQEIETSLIDAGGPTDRMPEENTVDDNELSENIATYGQLVPVLLRPNPGDASRYQIVYGRRRLKACRTLGISVKANVRDLTDEEAVIAQGQENSSRKDLSYHERFRYALAIEQDGFNSTTIQAALNVQRNRVSEYLKIARAIPLEVSDAIGSAPGIGRDRWEKLRGFFESSRISETRALKILGDAFDAPSDDRFQALLVAASKREPRPGAAPVSQQGRAVASGITVKSTRSRLTVSVDKDREGFAAWFDRNAEALITDLHAKYLEEETGAEDPEESSNDKEAQAR